jgi:hypothetical protein
MFKAVAYRPAGTEKKVVSTIFCVICLISGFRREVTENCAPPGFYAASSGNFLPKFRDNLPIPSARVKFLIPRRTQFSYFV